MFKFSTLFWGLQILLVCFSTAQAQNLQVHTITQPFPGSGGVSYGADGSIYVGNFGDSLNLANGNQVWKIDLDGTTTVFATGLSGASGNSFDNQGNLLQSNIAGGFISRIDTQGNVTTVASAGIVNPVGVVSDSSDNIYVCNCGNNTIVKIPPGGNAGLFSSGSLFFCPNGITIDENQNLYVANFSNGNVIKITPDGTPSLLATIPGNNNGHLIYKNGFLFVASHGSSRIYLLTLDGSVVPIAGSGVRGNDDGPAQQATFSLPNGIDTSPDGDTIFVNTSIPLISTGGVQLNPSLLRMITGVNSLFVGADELQVISKFEIDPNPARGQATIRFSLTKPTQLSLRIYDQQGREVPIEWQQSHFGPREHTVNISLEGWRSGIHYVSLLSETGSLTRRLVVLE